MKKVLFSFIATALLGVTTLSAQGFKGKVFIMGEAGYSTQNDGNIKKYTILPVVGTFIAPATAVGLGIGYTGTNTDLGEKSTKKEGTFIVKPLVRQYWGLTDNLFIFGQAAIPLGFGNETAEAAGVKTKTNSTSYGLEIAPGIDYFLSKNFSIEASLGLFKWNSTKTKGSDAINDIELGVNSGFLNGAKLGFKYIF